jgi:UDP-N-acetylmuramoylalanine--D-glutamate ligase
MEEAVSIAWNSTEPGDVMLLSPACSSFDMFESYAQRGNVFSKEVKYLKVKEK